MKEILCPSCKKKLADTLTVIDNLPFLEEEDYDLITQTEALRLQLNQILQPSVLNSLLFLKEFLNTKPITTESYCWFLDRIGPECKFAIQAAKKFQEKLGRLIELIKEVTDKLKETK